MDDIGIDQLAHALRGVSYPAPRWQLLAWADYNAVNGQLRDVVWQLPEGTYANLGEVRDVIAIHARFRVPAAPAITVPTVRALPRPASGLTVWPTRSQAGRRVAWATGLARRAGA
jgi:hypothetical protein